MCKGQALIICLFLSGHSLKMHRQKGKRVNSIWPVTEEPSLEDRYVFAGFAKAKLHLNRN